MSETETKTRQGGCACGEIRYEMFGDPLFVNCCHCTECQRLSGGAFAINAMIESDRVSLLKGEPEVVITPSTSGKGQKIHRCKSCMVAVWSNYAGAGDALAFVRVGTLDNPNACPPDIHIYTSTKQDWVSLDDGKPVMEEYYSAKEQWPAESLERMGKLLGK